MDSSAIVTMPNIFLNITCNNKRNTIQCVDDFKVGIKMYITIMAEGSNVVYIYDQLE